MPSASKADRALATLVAARVRVQVVLAPISILATLPACNDRPLTRSELMRPESCGGCHPDHLREWSGSMHAYAGEDPVFIAMNERGQRETRGGLGDFCVRCHAPVAVLEGLTVDGLNLSELPAHFRGVTCYFCHTIRAVTGDHNAAVELDDGLTLFGPFSDAVETNAHRTASSALHDRAQLASSSLCGSCHDVVTPKGVHLERTFAEWRDSLYAQNIPGGRLSCGACHMESRVGRAALRPGAFERLIHDHSMPGVDIALTDFPERSNQRLAVERSLDSTVQPQICVDRVSGGLEVTYTLENLSAGHHFPSGAAQDRRLWAEVRAFLGDRVMFESGAVGHDQPIEDLNDPSLIRFGDRIFDAEGHEVHMFWDADRFESDVLIAPTAADPRDPRFVDPHVSRKLFVPGIADRVTAVLNLRPIGLAILDDLIESGDLDPVYRARMPTFTLDSSRVEWRVDLGQRCVP